MADQAAIPLFYGYGACGTCRKAQQWLKERGIPVEVIDITTTPPSRDQLRMAFDQLDGLGRLFNTSGQSYRALGAKAVKAMTPEDALAALAADGKLIKRPFLIVGNRVTTGFRPQEWADLLEPDV